MKPTLKLRSFLFACGSLLAITDAYGADGTWTSTGNGNWSDATKWDSGTVADGTDFSAYLSDVITGNRTITLDTNRTIGNIYAQDTSNDYTISHASNILTLDVTTGSPEINVVANRTLYINAIIAGTDGLTKTGDGRLKLRAGDNTYTGATVITAGEIEFQNNITNTSGGIGTGNLTINGGAATAYWGYSFARAQGSGDGEVQITGGISGFGGNGSSGGTFNIGDVTWGSATFNPTEFLLQTAFANPNGNSTFTSNIDLNGADRIIRSNQTGGDIVSGVGRFTGNITNGGAAAGLTKTGIGSHVLSGTNTYDGGTTINEGSLLFDGIAAMPASGNVQVNDGAILGIQVGGGGNWTTGASGVGTVGGLLAGDGGAGTSTVGYSGNVGLRLDMASNSTFSGDIANVGATLAIHKTGGSSLTLNGNNAYSGGTFLYQGNLIADSATALGSGDITFKGGTLQYTANSAAADFGSQIANSSSAMLINTNGQNVTLSGIAAGNTGGLTKSGGGTLTFTGTNTYSGATNLSAGTIAVYDGTLSTSGGAVSMTSNTSISVLGGTGVTSKWDLNGQQLGTPNNSYTNLQITIDGDGVAGSALVDNVGILNWGRTANNSTILLTDGGQMNVNGEVRIGNPYYNTNGGANITIGGGTATSTFSGDGGDDFYIGYGERRGASNNVVTVSSGGVLTNIRDMFVGHVNNAQNNGAPPASGNQLTVTGTGTASMRGISVGYAQAGFEANANVVEVTSGGSLSSTGTAYIGRANVSGSQSNSNTLTVSGTDSSWDAGNQDVYVGHTSNSAAESNGNILTVGTGGELTNVNNMIVGFGSGTATGNQLVVNGILSATTVTVSTGNFLSGSGTINGAITINGALTPGNSPGQMTVTDSLTLGAASSTVMELGGTVLGTGYDNITLDLNTATALAYGGDLSVINFGAFDMDLSSFTYDLFTLNSVTPTGDFNSVTVNSVSLINNLGVWTGANGGVSYSFDQSIGDLTVTVIPEPNVAALLGALGTLLLLRRRR